MANEQGTSKDLAKLNLLRDARDFVGKSRCSMGHSPSEVLERAKACVYCAHQATLYDDLCAAITECRTHEPPAAPSQMTHEWLRARGYPSSPPRAGRLTKCPFCNSPSKADGSIQHSAGCEGLEDAGYSKLQIHVLENTLVAAIDRATQPPGGDEHVAECMADGCNKPRAIGGPHCPEHEAAPAQPQPDDLIAHAIEQLDAFSDRTNRVWPTLQALRDRLAASRLTKVVTP